jgi:hypothetical protein
VLIKPLAIVLAGWVVLATSGVVHATATSQDIVMSPASSQLSARPGGTVAGDFDTINPGTTAFDYRVYVEPYWVRNAQYQPSFTSLPGKVNASKWLTIASGISGRIEPGMRAHVRYKIHIPLGTTPGGYYVALFAEAIPPPNSQGVVATNRVGSIVYITAEGQVRRAGKLNRVPLPHIIVGSTLSLPVTISNTGGIHFVTTTHTFVATVYGKSIFRAQTTRYVLPETVREIDAKWNVRAPFGLYHVDQSADIFGKRQVLPGCWIFIVQWWAIVLIVGGIMLLACGLVIRRHQRKRSARRVALAPEADKKLEL